MPSLPFYQLELEASQVTDLSVLIPLIFCFCYREAERYSAVISWFI